MATETIDIRVREDGARVVRRNIEDIGDSATKSAKGVDVLKKALGGVVAYLGVQQIKNLTSAWTDLHARTVIAAGSHERAAAVMDRLQQIARRTYASLEDTAEIYLRNSLALDDLGYSTQQQLDFTEAMANALIVSGAKAQQAETVINALSKAMMQGKLSGMNWTTVLQQGGRVVQALADGLGVSVDQLRRMAEAGQLTSDRVMPALLSQLEQLREEADGMPATINDALQVLQNKLLVTIGTLGQSTGFTDAMVVAIDLVSDNLDLLIMALGAVGIAVAVAFAPTAVLAFMGAVKTLFALLMAHPLAALAAAIGFAVMYLVEFGDEINAGIDDVTSMKDVMRAFGQEMVELWDGITTAVSAFFGWFVDVTDDAYKQITKDTRTSTGTWADSYVGFYDGVGTGFAGVARGIARTIDAIAGLLTGFGITIWRTFAGIPELIRETFNRGYNAVVERIEALINATIKGINRLRALVAKDPIELVQFERKEVNEAAYRQYGQHIARSIEDGFMSQGGFMEGWVDGLFDRAQGIAQERIAGAGSGGGGGVDLGGGSGVKQRGMDPKELDRLRSEFNSLLGTVAPLEAAQLALSTAQDTLNNALRAGIITAQDHARYMEVLGQHYRDALDPLGALNEAISEQMDLLGMSAGVREVEAQMRDYAQQLQQQGVSLTEEETEALRAKLVALQDLTAVVSAQDALLAGSVGTRQQFVDQLQAMQNLLADPSSGFGMVDAISNINNIMPELLDGTQEFLDMRVAQFADMYEQIDLLREADLISEQTAAQMKAKLDAQLSAQRLAAASQFFGNLSALSRSENRKMAAIGKAAAVTQATIDGVLAVQKALASSPPPANYALATGVGIATAANVADIMSANVGFMTGGEFKVGGYGGADSQMVAFRATPGERVRVDTPRQVRKGDAQGGQQAQAPAPEVNQRIINVLDPAMVGDFLSTPEGEQTLINVMRRNSDAMRQVVSEA